MQNVMGYGYNSKRCDVMIIATAILKVIFDKEKIFYSFLI